MERDLQLSEISSDKLSPFSSQDVGYQVTFSREGSYIFWQQFGE